MRPVLKSAAACTFCLLLVFTACKKKKNDSPGDAAASFDTKGMLTNVANNLVVPAYKTLNSSAAKLDSNVAAFNANPTATTLLNLQAAFKAAYMQWQQCSEFEFGPADQQYLKENINTFPADTDKIHSNITSGNYNLAALINYPAKGFPGLDYLLFGSGDNNAVLTLFTTDSKAESRKHYLAALSADLETNISPVAGAWQNGYANTFISTTGTDAGSSVGQLINALDFDLEILKNDKLGIPLGKQSMGELYPAKTEAYYSGISSQLALLHLKAIQAIYTGSSMQGNGLGLDDYLTTIKAQYNDGSLNDAINSRFATAIADLGNVPDPLSGTIRNNAGVVNTAYTDIQKLVVFLKTDMPSAMGVLITYDDTDGD